MTGGQYYTTEKKITYPRFIIWLEDFLNRVAIRDTAMKKNNVMFKIIPRVT